MTFRECKGISMETENGATDLAGQAGEEAAGDPPSAAATRDIADVPAVELITTTALHLMSAAAVKVGLAPDEQQAGYRDLDEARKLITALAGLVTASAPELGSHHAAPLRDGLKSLQRAVREAWVLPDPPGQGPGEKFTGPVYG